MGAAVVAQRQLQHVLEIVGQHGVTAAVGEAIGMQRDQHAAADREQPERQPTRPAAAPDRTRPAGHWPPARRRERIDDAAEQDRLGELRGRKRHVGDGQQPSEPGLGPELCEDARIEYAEGS